VLNSLELRQAAHVPGTPSLSLAKDCISSAATTAALPSGRLWLVPGCASCLAPQVASTLLRNLLQWVGAGQLAPAGCVVWGVTPSHSLRKASRRCLLHLFASQRAFGGAPSTTIGEYIDLIDVSWLITS